MLKADNLLHDLNCMDDDCEYKSDNDDFDFGKVLEFCATPAQQESSAASGIRCSDGICRIFTFPE